MFVSQGQSVPHSHSSEALFKKNKIYPGRGTDENCCGASYCPGLQEADFQKEAEVSEHANVDGPQVRPTAWRLQGSTQVKALSGVWCSPTAPPLSSQKPLSDSRLVIFSSPQRPRFFRPVETSATHQHVYPGALAGRGSCTRYAQPHGSARGHAPASCAGHTYPRSSILTRVHVHTQGRVCTRIITRDVTAVPAMKQVLAGGMLQRNGCSSGCTSARSKYPGVNRLEVGLSLSLLCMECFDDVKTPRRVLP